jgi:glucuronoarabinoxylan endo-1,4-beta-xylanase
VRVDVTGSAGGIYGVTAYKNPSTGDFAIVVVNSSGGNITASFRLSGGTASTVTPYVTSGTPLAVLGTTPLMSDGNLSPGSPSAGVPSSITLSGNTFASVVPYGVTTFVGTAH